MLPLIMDDAHTKFQYTDDNRLLARYIKFITSDQSCYKLGETANWKGRLFYKKQDTHSKLLNSEN